MLGEKRSKAAFFGDSGQSVQEEKVSGMSHEAAPAESREPAPELTDKSVSYTHLTLPTNSRV